MNERPPRPTVLTVIVIATLVVIGLLKYHSP
jgi:hypothetical protein